MIRLKAKSEFSKFESLVKNRAFWAHYQDAIWKDCAPQFVDTILAGAVAGSSIKTKTKAQPQPGDIGELTFDQLETIAESAIQAYKSEFLDGLTKTTKQGILDAVIRARRDGTGVEGVLKDISQYFDPARAQTIAITETTRLFGIGAQAAYKAQGVTGWEWKSSNDSWVDAECKGLVGKTFPIDKAFGPAHPRCRCFPAPVMLPTSND